MMTYPNKILRDFYTAVAEERCGHLLQDTANAELERINRSLAKALPSLWEKIATYEEEYKAWILKAIESVILEFSDSFSYYISFPKDGLASWQYPQTEYVISLETYPELLNKIRSASQSHLFEVLTDPEICDVDYELLLGINGNVLPWSKNVGDYVLYKYLISTDDPIETIGCEWDRGKNFDDLHPIWKQIEDQLPKDIACMLYPFESFRV